MAELSSLYVAKTTELKIPELPSLYYCLTLNIEDTSHGWALPSGMSMREENSDEGGKLESFSCVYGKAQL